MHLCAIALHRYHGIAHPLRMRTSGVFGRLDGGLSGIVGSSGSRHVAALVGPAWGIAVALSIPFLVQGVLDRSYVLAPEFPISTTFDNRSFAATSSPDSSVTCINVPPFGDSRATGSEADDVIYSATADDDDNDVPLSCGIFNRSFAIYSSLVSFFIPLGVMIVADFRSVQILRKNMIQFPSANTPVRTKSSASSLSSSSRRERRRTRQRGLAPSSVRPGRSHARGIRCFPSSTSCYGAVTDSNDADNDEDDESPRRPRRAVETSSSLAITLEVHPSPPDIAVTSDLQPCNNSNNNTLLPNGIADRSRTSEHDGGLNAPSTVHHLPLPSSTSPSMATTAATPSLSSSAATTNSSTFVYRGRSRSKSMVYIDMLASCGSTKTNGRERRAEKTLIWVFAAFVALWLPFFCANLAYGLCGFGFGGTGSDGTPTCDVPPTLFATFTWLGYLSSGVNPCIYTLLNRDFRSAFRYLITCRHGRLRRNPAGSMMVSSTSSRFARVTTRGDLMSTSCGRSTAD